MFHKNDNCESGLDLGTHLTKSIWQGFYKFIAFHVSVSASARCNGDHNKWIFLGIIYVEA